LRKREKAEREDKERKRSESDEKHRLSRIEHEKKMRASGIEPNTQGYFSLQFLGPKLNEEISSESSELKSIEEKSVNAEDDRASQGIMKEQPKKKTPS
jgi:hypothetical protein